MKRKITDAEAVQAADTLRKFCNQFAQNNACDACDGCPFFWKYAPMRDSTCRLYRFPVCYNLRTPKKHVEAAKK